MIASSQIWSPIDAIDRWIDNNSSITGPEQDLCRIAKIGEELGEAIAAYIGYRGQNPRKGYTHNHKDILNELCDVAITALCAVQHFTKDQTYTEHLFLTKLSYVTCRTRQKIEPIE